MFFSFVMILPVSSLAGFILGTGFSSIWGKGYSDLYKERGTVILHLMRV